MNILLFTIGSHGDVHPFVGLGVTLRRRGHRVTLITNGHFEPLARAAGLEFAMLGTDQHFRELMEDPDLWHPLRGFDTVFQRGVLPSLEQAYGLIQANYVPGETVMVASSLGLAARIAQEKLGIPMATAHLAPVIIRTVYETPKLPGLFMPAWMPLWLKRTIWNCGDKYYLDPRLAPKINEFRARLGLKTPATGIINQWWNSPTRIIGMWPDWFGPLQPDAPPQLRLAGFPLFDEEGITPLSDELDQWLGAGDPPIAFTPGSAMLHGAAFFAESVKACVKLNRRGLLLTRHAGQIPRDLPPNVRHVDYAPFGRLLPRCAALVHHGGIGTTAQGLRSGTPQIVMPMSHDQFDNANRVQRLGAGESIRKRSYTAGRVAACLDEMLHSPKVRESCTKIAAKFEGVNGLESAADLVEALPVAQNESDPVLSKN